jgi:uncharacterized protein
MARHSRKGRSLLRTESFGSASVTWLDREAALQAATDAALGLAERFPEIEAILLFGSLARGDATPASDVDLLIILSSSDLPFLDRIPRYTPVIAPLGVEALPYTWAEFRRMREEGNPLIAAALADGHWLYGSLEPVR